MPLALTALRQYQWGLESTSGTAVPATAKVAVEGLTFTPTDFFVRPRLAKGLITRNPGNETVIGRGTTWSVPETPFVYDQGQQWLAMAVEGGQAAVGASTPYTWTFTRDITADPAVNTRTLEQRISDGTNHIDYEYAYACLSQLRFIYATDQPLRLSAEGFARRVQGSTLTSSMALPAIEIPPAPLAVVSIDSTWANLGTTPITGQVLSADVTFMTGYGPKMTLDGRTDLDFTTNILNSENVGLDVTIRMLVKANSGQFATEKTAAEAGTLRAVRLTIAGTASRALTLNMLLKHDAASIQTIGSEDGQDIVEMKLVDATDATNLFEVVLVNTLNTTL